eukprot:CAMPEP_0113880960 /NCGR_PEP_ID=MMETSP0780_2-20120614/8091_1 /TAXON_ID=652834 /ORGANISM="Palpitomonas bilix" /LENGTH=265 /DNA_ID=CAMNT_0000867725 /DNA_START=45 /DNA_END=842 /DNA_ORIENTATION=+ /assembly_acc=CAM_ASM_000599
MDNLNKEEFQKFLDSQQYTRNGILRYEKVFGRGFVSTGGKETTEMYAPLLKMKSGEYLLDVGCGIGGSAFHFVKSSGCKVLGVDLSQNMLDIGKERAVESGVDVEFLLADATRDEIAAPATFDAVYSRDAILHIADKVGLFKRMFNLLKPGGRLLITDYNRGPGERSPEFEAYVKQRGYSLVTVEDYKQALVDAGFVNVTGTDNSETFMKVLEREISEMEANKDKFVEEFSQNDYDYLMDGWKAKVGRCTSGDQTWGLYTAEKPL